MANATCTLTRKVSFLRESKTDLPCGSVSYAAYYHVQVFLDGTFYDSGEHEYFAKGTDETEARTSVAQQVASIPLRVDNVRRGELI